MDELDYTQTVTRLRTWIEIPLVMLSGDLTIPPPIFSGTSSG